MPFFDIEEAATGIYKDRGSRFLAFAYGVDSLEEVQERVGQLRKKIPRCPPLVLGLLLGIQRGDYIRQ